MTTSIRADLIVRGVDLTDDEQLDRIESQLPALAWYREGSRTVAVLAGESDDVVAFARGCVRSLSQAGVSVAGIAPQWVTVHVIAQRMGVAETVARGWTAQADFPSPAGVRKRWSWPQVNEWLAARGWDDGFVHVAPGDLDAARRA